MPIRKVIVNSTPLIALCKVGQLELLKEKGILITVSSPDLHPGDDWVVIGW